MAPIGQPKLEWNGSAWVRRLLPIQRVEEAVAFSVASQQNRYRVGRIKPEPIAPFGVMEQRDAAALSTEMISGRETGQTGAEDEDGL